MRAIFWRKLYGRARDVSYIGGLGEVRIGPGERNGWAGRRTYVPERNMNIMTRAWGKRTLEP
jgi:hypothetical protein